MAKSKKYKKNRRTKRRNNKRITRRGGGILDMFRNAPVAPEAPKSIGQIGPINIEGKTSHKTFFNKDYIKKNYPDIQDNAIDDDGYIYKYTNESNIYVIPNYKYKMSINFCINNIFKTLTNKTYDDTNIYNKHKVSSDPLIGIVINLNENKCAYFVFLQDTDNKIEIKEYGDVFNIEEPYKNMDMLAIKNHINTLIENCKPEKHYNTNNEQKMEIEEFEG